MCTCEPESINDGMADGVRVRAGHGGEREVLVQLPGLFDDTRRGQHTLRENTNTARDSDRSSTAPESTAASTYTPYGRRFGGCPRS